MLLAGTEGKFVVGVGGGADLDPGKLIRQAIEEEAIAFEGERVGLMADAASGLGEAGLVGEGARIEDGLVEETDVEEQFPAQCRRRSRGRSLEV